MTHEERNELASRIIKKLKSGVKLTEEEIQYAAQVLEDPLDEFCYREGTFRMIEMCGVTKEDASSLEQEAHDVIRSEIDYCETLYDYFDEGIVNMLETKGFSMGYVKEVE